MNMEHRIKLSMHYADAVYYGEKNFEVRYNDRGYQKGDEIRFKVVDETGIEINHPLNKIKYEITYLIHAVGLKEGWCVFGIREIKAPEEGGGMICPRCKSRMCRCVDSRQRRGGRYRRYTCPSCGEKFSTIERYTPIEEDRKIRYLMNTLQRIEREMKAARMAVKRGTRSFDLPRGLTQDDREETI